MTSYYWRLEPNSTLLLLKPINKEMYEQHIRTLNQEFKEGKIKGAKALESAKVGRTQICVKGLSYAHVC